MTEAAITLYLDLEENEVADLEVVARAALAWSAAIKEIAFVLDPSLEVRVELASGTQGSLSLNSLLRSVRETLSDKQTLRTIVVTAIFWTIAETRDYTFGRVLDWLTGSDAPVEVKQLSPAEIEAIAEQVADAIDRRVAEPQVKQMYRELERDPVIRGVGATAVPNKKPDVIVPREEFAKRAGHAEVREVSVTRRTIPEQTRLALIRPVLVQSDRRWGFKSAQGEFGAVIKDHEFTERVLSGTTSVPMMAGIEMDVDLETTEELQNGVWVPIERNVMHVIRLHQPPRQTVLPFGLPQEDEPDNPHNDDYAGDPKREG